MKAETPENELLKRFFSPTMKDNKKAKFFTLSEMLTKLNIVGNVTLYPKRLSNALKANGFHKIAIRTANGMAKCAYPVLDIKSR